MKKYKVRIESRLIEYSIVNAKDEEEAYQIAIEEEDPYFSNRNELNHEVKILDNSEDNE